MAQEMTFGESIVSALEEVMEQDRRGVLIGGGLVSSGPGQARFARLRQKYASRIKSPPIAELGFCGIAAGAAMAGLRPIVDYGTATFSYEAIPQIINEAAIAYSNSGGQTSVPIIFHMLHGVRGAGGVQHSGSPQPGYWNTPGLQVAEPGTPADVKGLFRWAALKSNNPTVFVNHSRLMELEGEVPDGIHDVPFGQAKVQREGSDVTIVACGIQVHRALEA